MQSSSKQVEPPKLDFRGIIILLLFHNPACLGDNETLGIREAFTLLPQKCRTSPNLPPCQKFPYFFKASLKFIFQDIDTYESER